MAGKPFQVLKQCKRCLKLKDVDSFYKNVKGGDSLGLASYCKECNKERNKIWADNNREKTRKATADWYARNKIRARDYDKRYREENKERKAETKKQWIINNPDKLREYSRRGAAKIRSTLKGRVNDALSSAMYRSLRGNKNGRHWEGLVGYSVDDLKRHIEKQFKDGMSWDNYGKYTWHIDHIIPVAVFNITGPECIDFKRCWALSNLQPLWAKENHSKGARMMEVADGS